jgi:hypothetical protein
MKKLSILLFYATISANGLSAMFSSENNGCFPEEGFRFKNRTVRYNKDLRLVIPKECREQELYDWVAVTHALPDDNCHLSLARELDDFQKKVSLVRYGKDHNVVFSQEKVTKKKIINPDLFDKEGNLLIAEWFASKGFRTFREPHFKETTIIEKSSISSYTTSLFLPEETIQHNYNDEYNYYRLEKIKEKNKQNIHSYINNMHLRQGIWTYIRGMRIVEWFFRKSQAKIENNEMFKMSYSDRLDRLKGQEIDELTRLLELTEAELDYVKSKITIDHKATLIPKLFEQQKILATNELRSFEGELQCCKNELEAREEWGVVQERLEKQSTLLKNEIKSLKKEENHLSFVRSTMKKSEFDIYQKFRLALARE